MNEICPCECEFCFTALVLHKILLPLTLKTLSAGASVVGKARTFYNVCELYVNVHNWNYDLVLCFKQRKKKCISTSDGQHIPQMGIQRPLRVEVYIEKEIERVK